jgi:carboxymethylenebutenolidase
MVETEIELKMLDGAADAVFFTPDAGTELPGVLHLPDIGGVREAHREMARKLAAKGYAVLLVNPFYRTSRPPVWTFQRKMGEPKTMQRFAELVEPLTVAAQEEDVAAYVDHLRAQTGVRMGKVGVVGYCFTGAMALRTAAARAEEVAAMASFHGGGLYKEGASASPHLLLPQVEARLYFGHATEDKSMSAEQIVGLEQALAAWDGAYESELYAASHGWTVPDNPVYNEPEAERAFGKLRRLFAETLG